MRPFFTPSSAANQLRTEKGDNLSSFTLDLDPLGQGVVGNFDDGTQTVLEAALINFVDYGVAHDRQRDRDEDDPYVVVPVVPPFLSEEEVAWIVGEIGEAATQPRMAYGTQQYKRAANLCYEILNAR